MRRSSLLLLTLLVATSPLLGRENRQAVADFKRNFGSGMTHHTRLKALEDLSLAAEAGIRKTFAWALAVTRFRVKGLVLEKDDAVKEVKRLQKQVDDLLLAESQRARKAGRKPRHISIPVTLAQGIERSRRRAEGLQQEIEQEYELREAAAEAMGAWLDRLSPEDQAGVLGSLEKKGLIDRDWTVRAFYAAALGKTSLPLATRLLLARLAEEKDRRVLPVVVDAAALQAKSLAVPDLVALLADERWQIRAAVISALGRTGSSAAIPTLIERLREEDGRLRGDIAAALKVLTGEDLGISPQRWETWWEANRDRFAPPSGHRPPGPGEPEAPEKPSAPEAAPPREGETVSFYGIRVVSKRILFVIDISNSMNQASSSRGKERTKVDVAKYELRTALLGLPQDAAFNIVFYHHEVSQWRKGMVRAKGKAKRAAVKFVDDMIADGNTNIHDALQLAFHIVGMGARDKNYEVGADTIFFLSDGIPNRGSITDPGQILSQVKRWNELRRVKIHSVGVGPDHDVGFMKSLAESSGGTYVKR